MSNGTEMGWADIVGDEYVGDDIGDEIGDEISAAMEEMGYADIVGDADIMGEIGARVARRLARRGGGGRGMARRGNGGGGSRGVIASTRMPSLPGMRPGQQLRNERATTARNQLSPFTPRAIAAGASETITWRPQRPIRPERLVLETLTGTLVGVTVTDFTIGAEPQFVNSGSLPASFFANNSVGVGIRADTVNPGIDITLVARNDTAAPVTLLGGLVGTSLT